MITELKDNEVFVFGSNIKGEHHGGAARQAFDDFGATWGIGEGLSGQTYAFPTLNENMQQYDLYQLQDIVRAFYRCARAHPELTFTLTKVGCGIAGYKEEYIKGFFWEATPKNIVKPEGW